MTACWGMTCAASLVSASWSPGALVASSWVVMGLSWLSLLLLPAQGSVIVAATAGVAGLSLCWSLVYWVEVATLVAAGKGG